MTLVLEILNDLQTMLNAVNLAQSKGAYKLEEAEILAKSYRTVKKLIDEQTAELKRATESNSLTH